MNVSEKTSKIYQLDLTNYYRPIKRVPMKESHFELPKSQYMESQSQKSRKTAGGPCPPPFDFSSENGETNEGSAFPFSSPKKLVSWEMVL